MSNLIKIRPVGAKLFHADGQTDMTKLIFAFRNFVKAPKNYIKSHYNIKYNSFIPLKYHYSSSQPSSIFMHFPHFVTNLKNLSLYKSASYSPNMDVRSFIFDTCAQYSDLLHSDYANITHVYKTTVNFNRRNLFCP
jgi:hypothetical protein